VPTGIESLPQEPDRSARRPSTHGLLAPVAHSRAAGLVPLARLMEESERALRLAAAEPAGDMQLAAHRILGSPEAYRRWEREHVRLIGRIADQNHRGRQSIAALNQTFSLVHNKSLFEYLRDNAVRSDRRRALIAHFRGDEGYVRHVVREYDIWLRAAASHLCLRHLGREVLRHPAYGEPLAEYEKLYSEYIRCYCEWAVPSDAETSREALTPVLAQLKNTILERRKELLSLPPL
jgi:hypothetical protein